LISIRRRRIRTRRLFIDATKQHALENDTSSIVEAVAGCRFPCPSPRFEIILFVREYSGPLSCFSCVENRRRQPWELPHDVTAITTFFFFPFSSGFSACAGAWSDFCLRVKAETEEVWGLFVFIAGGAMSEFKEESSSGTIAGSNASGPAANSYVLYLSPEDDRYQK
jgi:hypothetical protein